MTDHGLVSIITPSYNSEVFIAETIDSILAQTYTNWELLITDDNSSDRSCEIVESYCKRDPRIKLFKLPQNAGPGRARNNSIHEASGRFIAFCDSDDRWYPEKLERQLDFMVKNGHSLTYTSYDACDQKGRIIGYIKCLPRLTKRMIVRDDGIGCLTAIYDAGKIGKHYMPHIRRRQDWCLWIDIIEKTGPAYGLSDTLALYRVRPASVSSNKLVLLKYNFAVYHEVRGHSFIVSLLLMAGYFLPYHFYKKAKQKLDFYFHSASKRAKK